MDVEYIAHPGGTELVPDVAQDGQFFRELMQRRPIDLVAILTPEVFDRSRQRPAGRFAHFAHRTNVDVEISAIPIVERIVGRTGSGRPVFVRETTATWCQAFERHSLY